MCAYLLLLQPYLCESFYVLLEYARTAMFFWFFIEGLHLHNVLTMDTFIDGADSTRRFVIFEFSEKKLSCENREVGIHYFLLLLRITLPWTGKF